MSQLFEVFDSQSNQWFQPDFSFIRSDGCLKWEKSGRSGVAISTSFRLTEEAKERVSQVGRRLAEKNWLFTDPRSAAASDNEISSRENKFIGEI